MKKIRLLTLMLVSTMLFTSCATLFRSKVTFTSNKPTADVVTVDNKTYTNVAFPLKVKAKAKWGKTHVTAINKDCKPVNFDIKKTFNTICLLDIPFYGVGIFVDLASGGVTKPQQSTYYIEFKDKDSKNDSNDEIQDDYIVQNDNHQQPAQQQPVQEKKSIWKSLLEKPDNKNVTQNNNQPQIAQQQPAVPIPTPTSEIKSDVDNAPTTGTKSPNTFVLIIANENYTFVDNVDYAIHDGEVFREYCIKTMGVPERQVWFYKDATGGIISGGVGKMVQAMSLFENSKAIVYYCGHGIPDEHTGDAYIVPTDGNGKNIATCYSLNKLYTTLASSNATSVTYFMDACFSGANKEGSMLVAARGVAREAKKEKLNGNTVVFSAASGDETAMTYKEKGHGLFTYFLLKKLQETKGDVSYGDLDKYIKDNVKRESFLTNEKVQTPTTNVSENAINNWKTMKLK